MRTLVVDKQNEPMVEMAAKGGRESSILDGKKVLGVGSLNG